MLNFKNYKKTPNRANFKKINRRKLHLNKTNKTSAQKIVNATDNLIKNARTEELKIWMRIVAVLICLVLIFFGIFIYTKILNNRITTSNTHSDMSSVSSSINSTDDELHSDTLEDRLLRYVNSKNKIETDYIPELYEYNGILLSQDMSSDLDKMLNASKKEGIELKISCGYVTAEEQQNKHESALEYYKNELGYSSVKAEASTMRTTPDGESSEHRTGLLITFEGDDKEFSKSEAYSWLYRNSISYGFILRYPENKLSYTGMNPSFTQFRYVGKNNARQMRVLDMCLEEYCMYLRKQ